MSFKSFYLKKWPKLPAERRRLFWSLATRWRHDSSAATTGSPSCGRVSAAAEGAEEQDEQVFVSGMWWTLTQRGPDARTDAGKMDGDAETLRNLCFCGEETESECYYQMNMITQFISSVMIIKVTLGVIDLVGIVKNRLNRFPHFCYDRIIYFIMLYSLCVKC